MNKKKMFIAIGIAVVVVGTGAFAVMNGKKGPTGAAATGAALDNVIKVEKGQCRIQCLHQRNS